jgi:hypothetical protein
MLELPVREGGMALDDPTKTATANFKASADSTLLLQRYVVEGTPMQPEHFMAHNQHMTTCASTAKSARSKQQEEKTKALEGADGGLGGQTRIAFKMAREYKTGAWFTVKSEEAGHIHLTEYTSDTTCMVSLRFDKPLVTAQQYCDYHRNVPYTSQHAATCGGGGNRINRHRGIQN